MPGSFSMEAFGSKLREFWRERRDLEGRADCENGVVGEVIPAAVLALPFACGGNDVDNWGESEPLPAGVGGFFCADNEMYVSMHRANSIKLVTRYIDNQYVHTNDCVLIFAGVIQIKQLSCAKSKGHALIIFTELVVDLGCNECSQFAFRE
jgi:hypothetical protein